jgi:hypothetical protein
LVNFARTPYTQEHVLQFWDELSTDERHMLAASIRSVDVARAVRVFDVSGAD